jgi:hypothetical protein
MRDKDALFLTEAYTSINLNKLITESNDTSFIVENINTLSPKTIVECFRSIKKNNPEKLKNLFSEITYSETPIMEHFKNEVLPKLQELVS